MVPKDKRSEVEKPDLDDLTQVAVDPDDLEGQKKPSLKVTDPETWWQGEGLGIETLRQQNIYK